MTANDPHGEHAKAVEILPIGSDRKMNELVPEAAQIAITMIKDQEAEASEPASQTYQKVFDEYRPRGIKLGAVAAEGSGQEHEQIILQSLEITRKVILALDKSKNLHGLTLDTDRSDDKTLVFIAHYPMIDGRTSAALNVAIDFETPNMMDDTQRQSGLDFDFSNLLLQRALKSLLQPKIGTGSRDRQPELIMRIDFLKDPDTLLFDDYEQVFADTSDDDSSTVGELVVRLGNGRQEVRGTFAGEPLGFGALQKFNEMIEDLEPYSAR